MNKNVLGLALLALAAAASPSAFAEDSQEETPQEERDYAATLEQMPPRIKAFADHMAELDRRYPDSAQVDPEKFLTEEGEGVALRYCQAIGFDGPCVVEIRDGQEVFVPYVPAAAKTAKASLARWWAWLDPRLFSIGVIPERLNCPSQYPLVQFYHDDEDRRNANGRGGWIGATVSNNNTTWRYCRIDSLRALSYRPLPYFGNQYDYSVLSLGALCPSGARRVIRLQENELWNNQNWNSGGIFPSAQFGNFTMTWYCHFDGGAPSWLGHMGSFPKLGFAHGVHAPSNFPKPWALAHGWVHQDDEDWFNLNLWLGWPDTVMSGGGNTWRGLVKVE
ncbi:hypothetical protein K4L06_03070 [Lysobacter sp. BMK333-48F3]|nr:hypothetical protein [Lysobacter sp. BMK333-48F3]MBX9400276.1 hypothetical protein [Lysobacter sp. BMK333-48F3]